MESNALAAQDLENLLVKGELTKLDTGARMQYLSALCKSLGLNPLTQPFEFITLQGKLQLYAKRSCTDQLRALHKVSIALVERQRIDDVYVVRAHARTPDGREDEATGAVNIAGLKGENLANSLMRAETKAKRRVTLSICGLGFIDESELDTVRGAKFENPHDARRGGIEASIEKVAETISDNDEGKHDADKGKAELDKLRFRLVELMGGEEAGGREYSLILMDQGWKGDNDPIKMADPVAMREAWKAVFRAVLRISDEQTEESKAAANPKKHVTTGNFAYLAEFKALKEKYGEDRYRAALGRAAWEKSNMIPPNERKKVLDEVTEDLAAGHAVAQEKW